VGIYVGDGKFAHASSSRGGVIDPMSNAYFGKRYVGARRVLP
jgi:lipoprotein Spr